MTTEPQNIERPKELDDMVEAIAAMITGEDLARMCLSKVSAQIAEANADALAKGEELDNRTFSKMLVAAVAEVCDSLLYDKRALEGMLQKATAFAIGKHPRYGKEITVEYRGGGKWIVRDGPSCLARDNQWEYEPLPSNRDEAFIARTRFDILEEAIQHGTAWLQKEQDDYDEAIKRRDAKVHDQAQPAGGLAADENNDGLYPVPDRHPDPVSGSSQEPTGQGGTCAEADVNHGTGSEAPAGGACEVPPADL